MKLVFDINCTLLKRIRSVKDIPKTTLQPIKHKEFTIFIRPHVNILSDFLLSHKIPYIFWSSCIYENTRDLIKLLHPLSNHLGFLSAEDCASTSEKPKNIRCEKWIKNLDKTIKFWPDQEDVYLVDDSIEKRYMNQNMISIKPFDGTPDDEILILIDKIHEMIECNDLNCLRKHFN